MPYLWRLTRQLGPLGCALALVGCGTQHATYVPDGRHGYVVTCGGLLSSWSSCLVKAGRACGSEGYEIIKGDEEDRTILIACQAPRVGSLPPRSSP